MRIDVSVVCAAADSQVAHEISDRLGQAAQARVWLEEVSEPVNEAWDRGLSSAGVILLLSPESVPGRINRNDWADLLAYTGSPPVAKLLVTPCKYPALLERKEFFRWSDAAVLRQLHRWVIGLHGDRGRQPPATAWQGSTEELWKQLVDRPGTQRVHDTGQARQFAHEAADHFRDVIIIRCAGRSLPMVLGELAQSIGVQLRGTLDEACDQIAGALADARLLLLLEGMESSAPFVREGQTSVLFAPQGDAPPEPSIDEMSEVFLHWPRCIDQCADFLPHVEAAIGNAEWRKARRTGQAAFAFLRSHERLFEAAHIARVLLRRAEALDDVDSAGWAREEISWIAGGERVRAASPPREQLTLLFT